MNNMENEENPIRFFDSKELNFCTPSPESMLVWLELRNCVDRELSGDELLLYNVLTKYLSMAFMVYTETEVEQ